MRADRYHVPQNLHERRIRYVCTEYGRSSSSSGSALIRANLPMDLYIAEMKVSDAVARKLKVKMSILQRNVSIDTSGEKDDESGTQPEATA